MSKPVPGQPELHLLFVCTGNTCRSPMAQAIAQDLLIRTPPKGLRIHIDSAGTGADRGSLPSPETAAALQSVGADPIRHKSQPVTRALIEQATAVYAMTTTHRRALIALAPDHESKILLLDPAGKDIPDPIGRGTEVYRHTAQTLKDFISVRLAELMQQQSPHLGVQR